METRLRYIFKKKLKKMEGLYFTLKIVMVEKINYLQ